MNPRITRLHADYEMICSEFAGHPYVLVVANLPKDPPERYTVTYRVPGLRWEEGKRDAVVVHEHVAEIYLHSGYPREKPRCALKTPIWHPNFGSYICIGDHWTAGETLVDVIVQIGDMIQYRTYNPKSPVNRRAAEWALANRWRFPVGNLSILQPHAQEPAVPSRPSTVPDELGISLLTAPEEPDIDVSVG